MTITTTKKPQDHSLAWYILIGVAIVCGTALVLGVPEFFTKLERILERLPPMGQVVAAIGGVSTLLALILNRTKPSVVVSAEPAIPATNPPPAPDEDDPTPKLGNRAPSDRERGSTPVRVMVLAIAVMVIVGVVAALTSGCGASAVRNHATMATIATVASAGAANAVVSATAVAIAACPPPGAEARAACLDEVSVASETAGAVVDLVVPLVGAYRDAVETGAIAGDNPSVLATLTLVAIRLLEAWPRMVEALRVLGIEVPALELPGGAS